jgi:hypothetical protein
MERQVKHRYPGDSLAVISSKLSVAFVRWENENVGDEQ